MAVGRRFRSCSADRGNRYCHNEPILLSTQRSGRSTSSWFRLGLIRKGCNTRRCSDRELWAPFHEDIDTVRGDRSEAEAGIELERRIELLDMDGERRGGAGRL